MSFCITKAPVAADAINAATMAETPAFDLPLGEAGVLYARILVRGTDTALVERKHCVRRVKPRIAKVME